MTYRDADLRDSSTPFVLSAIMTLPGNYAEWEAPISTHCFLYIGLADSALRVNDARCYKVVLEMDGSTDNLSPDSPAPKNYVGREACTAMSYGVEDGNDSECTYCT